MIEGIFAVLYVLHMGLTHCYKKCRFFTYIKDSPQSPKQTIQPSFKLPMKGIVFELSLNLPAKRWGIVLLYV